MIPDYYWTKVADSMWLLSISVSIYLIGHVVMRYIEGIWRAKKNDTAIQSK